MRVLADRRADHVKLGQAGHARAEDRVRVTVKVRDKVMDRADRVAVGHRSALDRVAAVGSPKAGHRDKVVTDNLARRVEVVRRVRAVMVVQLAADTDKVASDRNHNVAEALAEAKAAAMAARAAAMAARAAVTEAEAAVMAARVADTAIVAARAEDMAVGHMAVEAVVRKAAVGQVVDKDVHQVVRAVGKDSHGIPIVNHRQVDLASQFADRWSIRPTFVQADHDVAAPVDRTVRRMRISGIGNRPA